MKILYLVILLFVFQGNVIAFQSNLNASEQSTPAIESIMDSKKKVIKLKTKLVSYKYCLADNEIESMQLQLKLYYENTGAQNVILYKGSDLVYKQVIACSEEELAQKKYEVEVYTTWYSTGVSEVIDQQKPPNTFVILSPGTVYEGETFVSVMVVRNNDSKIDGAVKSGEHFLQVTIPTWPESRKLAKTLSERWSSDGIFWAEPITSEPMKFTVDKERQMVDCSSD